MPLGSGIMTCFWAWAREGRRRRAVRKRRAKDMDGIWESGQAKRSFSSGSIQFDRCLIFSDGGRDFIRPCRWPRWANIMLMASIRDERDGRRNALGVGEPLSVRYLLNGWFDVSLAKALSRLIKKFDLSSGY